MPRTMQCFLVRSSRSLAASTSGDDATRHCLDRDRRLSLRSSPWIVAGVVLLGAGEPTMAQGVQTVAAITTEGAGSLGLGALVGAVVAGGFALRERFRRD